MSMNVPDALNSSIIISCDFSSAEDMLCNIGSWQATEQLKRGTQAEQNSWLHCPIRNYIINHKRMIH